MLNTRGVTLTETTHDVVSDFGNDYHPLHLDVRFCGAPCSMLATAGCCSTTFIVEHKGA
jgi:hypothetical protein